MFDHIDTKHSNVIVISEKTDGYTIVIHFLSSEQTLSIHRQIPRSYRLHLGTMSYGDATPEHTTITGIGRYVPDITYGKDHNEVNQTRLLKIKQILRELLPDFRVVTQLYIPNGSGSFRLKEQIEGWI